MKKYLAPSVEMALCAAEDILALSFVGNDQDDNLGSWTDLFGGLS